MSSVKQNTILKTLQFSDLERKPVQAERRSQPTIEDGRLLTPKQVADRLGVSERWVRDHAARRRPRIPAVKLGPLLRFRSSDIDAFVDQNRVGETSQEQAK